MGKKKQENDKCNKFIIRGGKGWEWEGVWDDVLMLWLLDWVVGSRYSLYHLKINDNERGFYMANDKSAPWSKDYN